MSVWNYTRFVWRVAAAYRVTNATTRASDGHPVRVLSENPDTPALSAGRSYDPLIESPRLYELLAKCPPSEEGILSFANAWGMLGEFDVGVSPLVLAGRKVEPIEIWVRAISEIRSATWIWDRLTSEDREHQKTLARRVLWERNKEGHTVVLYDSHTRMRISPSRPIDNGESDDHYARVRSQ